MQKSFWFSSFQVKRQTFITAMARIIWLNGFDKWCVCGYAQHFFFMENTTTMQAIQ
jgi:hypothetical protein